MAAMNERFEMRVDEDILARVDMWRVEQEDVPSRAEAMRRLVEIGLGKTRQEAVSFSDGEKLLMMMLRDLYKHLKVVRGEIDPDFIAEAIWGGHYWAPKWEMPGLFHDHEDRPADLKLVLDVLDMWTALERGYAQLSKKDRKRVQVEAEPFGKPVRFAGFDGNNEAAHLGIARFLVEKMDRFTVFKGRDLNSHMHMIPVYQRMLNAFEPWRGGLLRRELDADEIIRILKAMAYPK